MAKLVYDPARYPQMRKKRKKKLYDPARYPQLRPGHSLNTSFNNILTRLGRN